MRAAPHGRSWPLAACPLSGAWRKEQTLSSRLPNGRIRPIADIGAAYRGSGGDVSSFMIIRYARRTLRQHKALHGRIEWEWSQSGIRIASKLSAYDFDWRYFVEVRSGHDIILLYQTETLFNFLPMRALQDALRTTSFNLQGLVAFKQSKADSRRSAARVAI